MGKLGWFLSSTVDTMRERRALWIAGVVAGVAVCVMIFVGTSTTAKTPRRSERAFYGEVKRVVNGHTVKLKHDERLTYAGIRAPYPHEPYSEQAKKRNAELVEGKKIRLRFDDERRDDKGRLWAYAFVGKTFVNETLVREGLAYVRVTPNGDRFAEMLLAAQKEARRKRRGIWRDKPAALERSYLADPKYGNFHRPNCEKGNRADPMRLVECKNRGKALEKGFAPCPDCRP